MLLDTLLRASGIANAKLQALKLVENSLTVVAVRASLEDLLKVRQVIRPRRRGEGSSGSAA